MRRNPRDAERADYGRFAQMLLNGGELDGTRLLKKETVELMTRNHTADVALPWEEIGGGFGLGFGAVTEGHKGSELGSVGTFSWGGFYNTTFWVDPQKNLVGILMTQLHPAHSLLIPDTFRQMTYAALGK
ncbi:serine hydrolase [Sorangium sp. So ce388]|uniref:serine hydrolase n=1 Tax=Sorangium sp. So ce388 TaxID=3133309 RepID=UPI003F5B2631